MADPADCSFQFNPTGTAEFTSSCDIAKQRAGRGVGQLRQRRRHRPAAGHASRSATTDHRVARRHAARPAADKFDRRPRGKAIAAFEQGRDAEALKAAGYPAKAEGRSEPLQTAEPVDASSCILTILVIYVTMVYGPIAAMLVELFPTRIRYTSMSLPYHIGNGWFGGLLPATAFAMVAQTGNIYYGLWYPIIIAADHLRDRHALRPETKDVDIYKND